MNRDRAEIPDSCLIKTCMKSPPELQTTLSSISLSTTIMTDDQSYACMDHDGQIKGQLVNTGRGLKFKVSSNDSSITISGGPLSYDYTLSHMLFHYGREDDRGSEHTISG